MKIWCDVCDQEEASVFCSADEASLCVACDRRVHHANKLASKHLRFSLVNTNFKDSPLCDICQERRALLFCQQDRVILCRECDLPIHKSNEYTKKHNRFLLTGVKLSPSSSVYNSSPSFSNCGDATIIDDENRIKSSYSISVTKTSTSSAVSNEILTANSIPSTAYEADDNHISDNGSLLISSISEYLMETLPGWRVEDFLDPSSCATTTTNVFCKTYDQFLPFGNQDLQSSNVDSVSAEDLAIWVPECPPQSPQIPSCSSQFNGLTKKSTEAKSSKANRKWRNDYYFTVPETSPPSVKKCRNFS